MDAKEFRQIRIDLCLTQKELAAQIMVSLDAVKSWETGRRGVPGPVKILMRFLADGGVTKPYLEL